MINIESIKQRNTRVEADKAWETPLTRRILIALGTYIIIGSYLNYLQIPQAWLHAIVPVLAYIISTLALNYVQLIWIKRIYKK